MAPNRIKSGNTREKPETLNEAELEAHPQFASTLANGLAILGCFANGSFLLGNKDFAEQLGMTRPTVSRLTFTLMGLGYLRRDAATGKYALGPAVLSLGYPLLSKLMIHQVAGSAMMALASYANGPISVGARDRLQVVYVETVYANHSNETRPGIGSTRPFLRTAMGRALLYGLPQEERKWVMERLQHVYPDEWNTFGNRVQASFSQLDERGFCAVIGDWRTTLAAVAVPMLQPSLGLPLAFNLTVPSYAVDKKKLENDLGPRLADLVHDIGSMLGAAR
ncbi:IclR family transcriptional regulator [Allopusillimonas soli]|uniref:IclR family transcriptional regulator n=1 Tax=Allopusillimonas soli TaxID=659016 RepID=UPI001FD66809|nr:IclR family transcriptional regulator [Allopusillimonas soli]